MKKMEKVILKGLAKMAEKAVQESCGSKSFCAFYEPEMPKALKNKKFNK